MSDSQADGIALMNGTSDNSISGNVVTSAGDDGISDDSYRSDAAPNAGNTTSDGGAGGGHAGGDAGGDASGDGGDGGGE